MRMSIIEEDYFYADPLLPSFLCEKQDNFFPLDWSSTGHWWKMTRAVALACLTTVFSNNTTLRSHEHSRRRPFQRKIEAVSISNRCILCALRMQACSRLENLAIYRRLNVCLLASHLRNRTNLGKISLYENGKRSYWSESEQDEIMAF
jgi:hypothetical protein